MTERRRKKGKLFSNDVKSLLYAFGDVENPLPETVSALEDVLVTYIIDTCHEASAYAKTTRRQKIKVEDFKFVLRRDPVKHGRVNELLALQKVITDARKQFDNSEGKSLKNLNYEKDDDDDKDLDDLDETGGNGDDMNTSNTANSTNSTAAAGDKKKNGKTSTKAGDGKDEDPKKKPKRKYNKDPNRERKPYKKRAKKGETASKA